MSALDAVEQVLTQTGKPMRVEEITRRILEAGFWRTTGKTPAATVSAQLAIDIKRRSQSSRFQRTRRGLIALRIWGLPEYLTNLEGAKETQTSNYQMHAARPTLLTLKDAAEVILDRYGGKQPMNYRDITQKALELGLVTTSREYAASNLLMEVVTDIARQAQRGRVSRFTKPGKGLIGLSCWAADDAISMEHA